MKAVSFAGLGLCLAMNFSSRAADTADQRRQKQIENSGHVRYELYDRMPGDSGYPGLTTFTLSNAKLHWTYQQRTGQRPEGRWIIITPRIDPDLAIDISHRVRLPMTSPPSSPWFENLKRHELDHVAISTDARVSLLIRHLFLHLPPIERPAISGSDASRASINAWIVEELRLRQEAVSDLIRSGYKSLDEASAHGRRTLPDRPGFFAGLYSEKRLVELDFPYLDAVTDLIRTDGYLHPPAPK